MIRTQRISSDRWNEVMLKIITDYRLYAPVQFDKHQDYERITEDNLADVVYNTPKPATPLKTFLLPVKENLSKDVNGQLPVIIMGIPACDLSGANLLREIYLDQDYRDPFFQQKMEQYIFIGYPCFSTQEHCHCTSYGIDPVPGDNSDLNIAFLGEQVLLSPLTPKGDKLVSEISLLADMQSASESDLNLLEEKQQKVKEELAIKNARLPDYQTTGALLKEADDAIWEKYASTCVSCGACATICPTCTCFLLVDRPEFEKVRQLDACQYPGFERVAAGEDPLRALSQRFRNRYLCKYVWKPERFTSIACTGCGRCIEACIGKINKNELFVELHNLVLHE